MQTLAAHHGKAPTVAQSQAQQVKQAELHTQTQALLPRYLSLLGSPVVSSPSDSQPWCKNGLLQAPSCFPATHPIEPSTLASLGSIEAQLRSKECLKALKDLCTACCVKALLLSGKRSNPKVQNRTTRANQLLATQTQKVNHAAWDYQNSQVAYSRLQSTATTSLDFPILHQSHINTFVGVLLGDRTKLGEGSKTTPWFCKPPYCQGGINSWAGACSTEGGY